MNKESRKLLKEIFIKCNGVIPRNPVKITLDSGEDIIAYLKSSTREYVSTVSKSPDAVKYIDYYTVSTDSNQTKFTIIPPEVKKKWFANKDDSDFIGESLGRTNGESDRGATFAYLGYAPESKETIMKTEISKVSLW